VIAVLQKEPSSFLRWPSDSNSSKSYRYHSPEEQAEDGERADVDAAAAQRAEDAAAESGHQKDGALPEPEVGDGVVGLAFVLPVGKI